MRWLFEGRRWERLVLALIGASIAYQLFSEPIVGTADNRDWWRVMKQVGLDYQESPDPTFFKSIQLDYSVVPVQEVRYLTSQIILCRVALVLNDLFSKDGSFDLRWMGFVNGAAFLAAIALFLCAFARKRPWIRAVVGVACLITLSDVRLIAYFNSFYCESAQLIFLIANLGLALLALDSGRSPRARAISYSGFVLTSVLFFFAKTQDLVFCFPWALIAYVVWPFERRTRIAKLAIPLLMICLFVWGMKSDAYAVTHNVNVRVTLYEEILPHSKTPEKDLQALGDGDPAKVTFGRIAYFYAKRPYRWWKLAKRRLHQAFTHTPYGNFEAPVVAESKAFDEFSSWKNTNYPRSIWFWISTMITYCFILANRAWFGSHDDKRRAIFSAMLLLGCVFQFIAVITFEANGTEKHFFIFNVLVDFVLLLGLFDVARVGALLWERSLSSHTPNARSNDTTSRRINS